MELTQLRAILALQELASFAKAGQQLHLSPPAVFGQIRQLEDELSEKLYERIGNRLQLTAAGEFIAERARAILTEHDQAVLALKEMSGSKRGVLRIGCGPHSSISIAPHLMRAYLANYPNTELRLITGDDQTLLKDVRGAVVDVVLMSVPTGDPELEQEALWCYEMVFVFPPKPKRGRSAATLDELRELPFILYRRSVVIDEMLRRVCSGLGFEPKIAMENDEPDSIIELVKLGIGVSMLPLWSVADEVERGELRILRPETPQVNSYGLVTRKTGYRPRALLAFSEIARKWRDWWPMAAYVLPVK